MARRRSAPEEPKQRKVAIAFAGPGDSTIENTTDLLDDFLGIKDGEVPEDEVLDLRLAFPVTREHLSAGLKSVVKWTDEYELAYDAIADANEEPTKAMESILDLAEDVTQAKNVEKALIEWIREQADGAEGGWEAYLVLLWGEEGDENSEVLLDLATSLEIKALDLTAGLDDISFGDEEEAAAEPEPEPEPEPEKPARSRRRRSSEPEEKAEEPPAEEEKPKRSRSRSASAKKAEEIGPTPEGEETLQESLSRVAQIGAHIGEEQPDEAQELVMRNAGWEHRPEGWSGNVVQEPASAVDLIDRFISALDAGPQSDEVTLARRRAQEARFWLHEALVAGTDLAHTLARDEAWAKFHENDPRTVTVSVGQEAPQEAAEPAQEPEEAPKRGRGRPRTRSAAERAVTEYYDEDDKVWVRAGRGRPPKGAKTRKVDPDTGEEI